MRHSPLAPLALPSQIDRVREFTPLPESLTGTLLIAHPGLLDPNFRKTVIFVSSHTAEEGAFGLILNRPSGQSVSQLLPNRDDLLEVAGVPVYLGGPVARDQLIFASFAWDGLARRLACRHHLSLEDAKESAREHRSIIRAFIGYSGWGKGQLEGELAQHAWLVKPPEEEVLKSDASPRLWRELLGGFGAAFRLAADAPDDPSRN